MELLDFLNEHEDWERILTGAPYYLIVKHNPPYVLLEYQQFASAMENVLCQQARGSIFRQNYEGKWVAVSIAMFKFFNYGQIEAAEIDWANASVSAKVDGSNIRLAYDHIACQWLISTTGSVDAKNADLPNGRNFKSEFIRVLGGDAQFAALCDSLSKQFTYYFELVSRSNKIVVNYDEEAIYYIGRRDMITFNERPMSDMPRVLEEYGIRRIPTYNLHSLNECVAAAEALEENNEGFVVTDTNFNRIKVKTPWYIAMHHIRGNGVLTVRRVVQMWQEDILDDFVGNFPEYQDFVTKVMDKIKERAHLFDCHWEEATHFRGDRKKVATTINEVFMPVAASYIFARMDDKVQNGIEWFGKWPYRKLADYISKQLDTTEYGVEEDL